VKLHDASTGDELATLRGPKEFAEVKVKTEGGKVCYSFSRGLGVGWIVSLAFSPDGKRLAAASSDHTARVWDVARDQEALTLASEPGSAFVAVSPDCHRFVQRTTNGIRLRDMTTGQDVVAVRTPQQVIAAASSPDGRRIAVAAIGGTVKVHDAASGKELITVKGA
jgi:WD40 repeat protein